MPVRWSPWSPETPFTVDPRSREFRKHRKQALSGKIRVGTDVKTAAPAFIDLRASPPHWLICGDSGAGKTRLAVRLLEKVEANGEIVVLIDQKGDASALYLQRKRARGQASKIIFIDPHDSRGGMPPGNLLAPVSGATIQDQAAILLDVLASTHGEDDRHMPWYRVYGYASLLLASLLDCTILEVPFIASRMGEPILKRGLALAERFDFHLAHTLAELLRLPPEDRSGRLLSIATRAMELSTHRDFKLIYGQTATLDFLNLIQSGTNVVYNLAFDPGSPVEPALIYASIEILRWLRVMETPGLPFRITLFVDEFQRLPKPVIRQLCQKICVVRSFGGRIVLCTQSPALIQYQYPDLWEALKSTANQIHFANAPSAIRPNAEDMFTGRLDLNEIKHSLSQTKFRPETVRRETVTTTEGEGEGWMDSYFSNQGLVQGSSSTDMGEDGSRVTLLSNMAQGSGSGSGSSSSRFKSLSRSQGYGVEHVPFKELTSVTFYSEQEQLNKVIRRIADQPPRHALLFVKGKAPQFVKVDPVNSPTNLDRLERVFPRAIASPRSHTQFKAPAEIEEEIRQRYLMLTQGASFATNLVEPSSFLVRKVLPKR